jgi:hypothetical protein
VKASPVAHCRAGRLLRRLVLAMPALPENHDRPHRISPGASEPALVAQCAPGFEQERETRRGCRCSEGAASPLRQRCRSYHGRGEVFRRLCQLAQSSKTVRTCSVRFFGKVPAFTTLVVKFKNRPNRSRGHRGLAAGKGRETCQQIPGAGRGCSTLQAAADILSRQAWAAHKACEAIASGRRCPVSCSTPPRAPGGLSGKGMI